MPLVLMAGLPSELASWLAERLPGVSVLITQDGRETLDELAKGECSLLIIDHGISGPAGPAVLEHARNELAVLMPPVMYCVEPDASAGTPEELAQRLGLDRLFFHPVDREEIARLASRVLSPLLGPPNTASMARQRTTIKTLTRVWEQIRETVTGRLETIERAASALLAGSLPDEMRENAEREAHKLGGLVGTFGYAEGTRLAKEMEQTLAAEASLRQADARRLFDLLAALQVELDKPLNLETRPRAEPRIEQP